MLTWPCQDILGIHRVWHCARDILKVHLKGLLDDLRDHFEMLIPQRWLELLLWNDGKQIIGVLNEKEV